MDRTKSAEPTPLILRHPVTKSCAAFLLSFHTLWQRLGKKYFWTFTPDGYLSDREFYEAWKRFLSRWRDWPVERPWVALRIFEPFQSGFLHCHLVCDYRFPVDEMRALVRGTGLGRIHVRRAVNSDGQYLAKYMSKTQSQRQLARGRRAWATIGKWRHTRVLDVEVESTWTKAYAFVNVQYPWKPWAEKVALSQEVYLQLLQRNCDESQNSS